MEWTDGTSYSRDEKERIPRIWVVQAGSLRIAVHRLHGILDAWFYSCEPWFHQADACTNDLEQAKTLALRAVRARVAEVHEALAPHQEQPHER